MSVYGDPADVSRMRMVTDADDYEEAAETGRWLVGPAVRVRDFQ